MQDTHERISVAPPQALAQALHEPLTRSLAVDSAGRLPDVPHRNEDRSAGEPWGIISVCESGSGWARAAGDAEEVRPGQAFVIHPHAPHAYGTGATPWTMWWLRLVGTSVPELFASIGATGRRPVLRIRSLDRVLTWIDEIISAYEIDAPGSVIRASGAAWRLLTQIGSDRVTPERGDPVQQAMDYIGDHLASELTVAHVAAEVGISPSRLSARFHETTGGGVAAYRIGLRMTRARQMLTSGSATVAEIGRALGYADPLYFSRRFRLSNGVSPTEFRHRGRA